MSESTRDPDSLFQAHCLVREAYVRVRKLRQVDPAVRETVTRLDEMASELWLEYHGPELPFERAA